ncbi:MAG: hypothetical protein AB1646_06880 [Thermodesulfobacteriota bacterium]
MPRTVARTAPNVTLPPEQVFEALCRIERVFRLNPHWTIRNWSASPSDRLAQGSVVAVDIEDYATSENLSIRATCRICEPPSRLELAYEGSRKLSTVFLVSEVHGGSRLTVEETYSDEEDPANFTWHKDQLEFWVRSLSAYLRLLGTRGWKAWLYQRFMDRFWIPASPSGRRISIVVFKISIVELVLILAIIVMWALFFQR